MSYADMTNEEIISEKLDIAWSKINQLKRERDEAKKEVETLETRHAAVMMHTQSVVDENTQLRAEIERLKKQLIGDNEGAIIVSDMTEEIQQLKSEVERLKADKARLDWLDSFNNTVTIQCEDGGIWIEIEDYKKVNDEPEKSLREAIDAAMKGAE